MSASIKTKRLIRFTFSDCDGPPRAGACLLHRSPVPGGYVRPTLAGIGVNPLTDAKTLVSTSGDEARPARTIRSHVQRQRPYAEADSLKALRG